MAAAAFELDPATRLFRFVSPTMPAPNHDHPGLLPARLGPSHPQAQGELTVPPAEGCRSGEVSSASRWAVIEASFDCGRQRQLNRLRAGQVAEQYPARHCCQSTRHRPLHVVGCRGCRASRCTPPRTSVRVPRQAPPPATDRIVRQRGFGAAAARATSASSAGQPPTACSGMNTGTATTAPAIDGAAREASGRAPSRGRGTRPRGPSNPRAGRPCAGQEPSMLGQRRRRIRWRGPATA